MTVYSCLSVFLVLSAFRPAYAEGDPPIAADDNYTLDEGGVLNPAAPALLTNDTDAEEDSLTAAIDSLPSFASAFTLNADGSFSYTHDGSENFNDSFTYTATDGTGTSTPATVTISINPVNDAPVIGGTPVTSVSEDTVYSFTPTADDEDAGATLTFSITNAPAWTSFDAATGELSGTPTNADVGTTSEIVIAVSDGIVSSPVELAGFDLEVVNVNDLPTAANQTVTTNEETAYVFQSSDFSFSDVDSGDALALVRITSLESAGALQLNSVDVALDQAIPESELGNLIFVPPQDANGAGYDSFQFRVHDGTDYSTAAYTMTVDVTAVSDAPSNDVVPEISGTLEEGQIVSTTSGSWTDNSNPSGSIAYSYQWRRADDSAGTNLTPIPGATLSSYSITTADVVKYLSVAVIATANGDSSPAAISAASGPVLNNVPVISQGDGPLEVTMSEDGLPTAWSAPALAATDANSGHTLSWGIVSGTEPSHGTATVSGEGSSPAVFSYLPAADYNGADSFTVQVSDGLATDTIQVSVTIEAVNDAPTAETIAITTAEDTAALITLAGTDADGDALNYQVLSNPGNGTLNGTAPDLTYTPDADFNGVDSFTYLVNDGSQNSSPALVSITIDSVNDLPTATADAASVAEDSGTSAIDVLANDSIQPDTGETLVVIAVTQGGHGSVVITGGGSGLTYQPSPDFNGSDSFQYTIGDGNGGTATTDVSVTVTSVNDPPTAVDDEYSVSEGGSLSTTHSLLANDSDVEDDPFTAELLSAPVNASDFNLNPDGTFSYTHDGSQTFLDSFTYTANDNYGTGNVATVTIHLTHQVAISWNPSFTPGVIGYEVSWGTESGKYGPPQDAGNATEDVISGLKGGTLYFIAVKAYDINGLKGDYSEEITYKKNYPDNPSKISGTVNRSLDPGLEPISDLPVCAIDSVDNFWAACAQTLADGSYEIENLPAGSYFVRAVAADFKLLGKYYPDAIDQSTADNLALGVGETRTGVNFVLDHGAEIDGAFYYDGDSPLENPIVYAEDSATKFVYVGTTHTSDSYTVSGLPSGSYRLRAETLDSNYIREYYRDAYDYDGSELVETSMAQPVSGIEFNLARGGSISGTVLRRSDNPSFDNQPIEGIWAIAFHEESGRWAGNGRTGVDGSYTITGLPAGNYHVRVETGDTFYFDAYYGETDEIRSATPVTVNSAEMTTEINFDLIAGGSISGTVTRLADGAPLSGLQIVAYGYGSGSRAESVQTRSDGAYVFPRLPAGSYMVRVETGDSQYLDQYYENTNEPAAARAITIVDQQETAGVDFNLIEGGRITGVVKRETDDQSLPGIRVNAYDYNSGELRGNADTQADGSYLIAKMPGGIYRIRADTDTDNVYGEYFDNTYHDDQAAAVAVELQQTTAGIDFLLTEFSGTDSDEDRLTDSDEINIYGTDVSMADTDGDGIDDKDEIEFWGNAWGEDTDGDGEFNLVDYDSDGDGFSDGYENQQGSDPINPTSVPAGVIAGTVNDNSAAPDRLFRVMDLENEMVFGTTSDENNIHSHYSGTEFDAQLGFVYSGRMRISDRDGSIGVTFLSQYPVSDTFYRLRSLGANDFHLAMEPDGYPYNVEGDIGTQVDPEVGTWYLFRIEVQDTGSRTEIRARVWEEGTAEPTNWQVDAYDDSAVRLRSGKIGLWAYSDGSKYWDDLSVETMDSSTSLYDSDIERYSPGSILADWFNTGPHSTMEIEVIDPVPLTGVPMLVELYAGDPCNTPQLIQTADINTLNGTYYFEGLDPAVESYYVKTERNGFDYLDKWFDAAESSPYCQNAVPIDISAGGRGGIDLRLDPDEYPFAYAETAFAVEDTASDPIPVIANDIDPDGSIDPGSVSIAVAPAYGAAVANADGTVVYTPQNNFSGTDSFTYTVRDNQGAISEQATVTVVVEPVNDPPAAGDPAQDYSVTEGEQLAVSAPGLLANYSDPEADLLSVILLQNTVNGSLVLNPDGSFTYIHDGGQSTSDSFSYQVTDGAALSDTTGVTIQITPVNDPPLAGNDAYGLVQGGTLTVDALAGVSANDTDADGDALTAVLDSPPSFAAAFTLNADGSFSYTHDGSANTADSFTYQTSDGSAISNIASVSIVVGSGNSAPIANNDTYATVNEGGTLAVDAAAGVRANDIDAEQTVADLSVILIANVSHGELTLGADGSFQYIHDGSQNLSDSFTYQVSDGSLLSSPAAVTFAIQPVNDSPWARDDAFSLAEETAKTVDVLANDGDADGDSLSVVAVTDPAGGSVVVNADNSITYTPGADFFGNDSFSYTVSDGESSADATVSVTVFNINDAPLAADQSVDTAEDTPVAVTLAFSDPDNDVLSFSMVSGPNHGTFNGTAPNLTYTPDADYNGTDSMVYQVNDGLVDTGEATVSITVTAVNDAPVVADIPDQSVAEGSTFAAIDLDDFVSDAENSDAEITWTVSGSNALAVSIDVNNMAAIVIPHADWNGSETIAFRASDSGGLFAENAALFTVTSVNDPPTDLTLSNSSVGENLPAGTLVGSLATTDVDDGDSHTYSLVAGAGDTGNGSFTIHGNEIRTAASFDRETHSSYNIRVRTADQESSILEKQFTIAVSNVNESPTIQTAAFTLAEDAANNTPVGTVAALDPDGGDMLTYGITAGNADGVFTIDSVSGEITVADNSALDFEATESYGLTVAVTDLGGLSDSAAISIDVTDVNDRPLITDQVVVSTVEDTPVTITLADLSVTDPDNTYPGDFTLMVGDGINYSHAGNIVTPDPDFNGTLMVTVVVDDGEDANSTSAAFDLSVTVTGNNDPPSISGAPAATTLEDETFSFTPNVTDVDIPYGDILTFNVANPPEWASFDTATGTLSGTPTNADVGTYTGIEISVSDSNLAGVTLGPFDLEVVNVNDAPNDITLSANNVDENQPPGTLVGILTADDPDIDDSQTFSLATTGGDNFEWIFFTIAGNELRTRVPFDFEFLTSYSFLVIAQDQSGAIFSMGTKSRWILLQ